MVAKRDTADDQKAGRSSRTIQPGRALEFNAVDQRVSIDTPITFSGEFTISFWIIVTGSDLGFGFAVGADDANSNKIGYANNATNFFVRVISQTDSSVVHGVDKNAWNNFAIRRNSDNKVDLIINGGSPIRLFSDVAQVGNSTWQSMGVDENNGGNFLDGALHSVTFFDRAVADAEIAAMAGMLDNPREIPADYPTDPVLQYNLDEGSTAIAYNSGSLGSAYDGTIINGASGMLYTGPDVPFSWQNLRGYSEVVNLFGDSIDLNGDQWDKAVQTITGGFESISGNEAFRLQSTGAFSRVRQTVSVEENQNYTVSFYVRRGSGSLFSVLTEGSPRWRITFDTTDFSIHYQTLDGYVFDGVVVELVDSENDEYRIEITVTVPSGVTDMTVNFWMGEYNANSTSGEFHFLSSVQIESGDSPTTFQRTSGPISAGNLLPLKANDPTQDVTDNAADYRGECPWDAALVNAPCITWEGTSYATLASSFDLVGDFDVSFQYQSTATTNIRFASSTGNVDAFAIYPNADFRIRIASVNYDVTVPNGVITNNGFPHVVRFVRSGSTVEVFFDGVSAGTVSAASTTMTIAALGAQGTTSPSGLAQMWDMDFGPGNPHYPCDDDNILTIDDVRTGNTATLVNATSAAKSTTQSVYHYAESVSGITGLSSDKSGINFNPEPDAPRTRGLTLPTDYRKGDGSSGSLVVGSSTATADSQFTIVGP